METEACIVSQGLLQGCPLSPPAWNMIVGSILKPLVEGWRSKGYGFSLPANEQWTTDIPYRY
eukprot:4053949-Prorocentrum_lima.AAC.1